MADLIRGELALPGACLRYQTADQGTLIVLLHGFALDMRMWEPQLALAAQFRLVRYPAR